MSAHRKVSSQLSTHSQTVKLSSCCSLTLGVDHLVLDLIRSNKPRNWKHSLTLLLSLRCCFLSIEIFVILKVGFNNLVLSLSNRYWMKWINNNLSRKFLGLYKEVTNVFLEFRRVISRLVESIHKLCDLYILIDIQYQTSRNTRNLEQTKQIYWL